MENGMLRARPVMRTRSPIRVVRRRRRWPWVSWWFSLLLVVPIVLIVADQAFGIAPGKDKKSAARTLAAVTFHVADAANGQAVAGAEVQAGTAAATSDAQGVALLTLPSDAVIVTVRHPGYQSVYGQADTSIARDQSVALRALPADQGQADATESANADGLETEKPNTGGGSAPESGNATSAEAKAPAPTADGGNDAPVAGQLTGAVTTEQGDPLKGALVAAGDVRVNTKRDGTFTLTGAPDKGELVVSASGYADKKVAVPAQGAIDVALARQKIEAVYLTGPNAGDPETVDRLIQLADDTEINAMVVDIKENYVWYDTGVEFFQDANAVDPSYDPRALVAKLHEHGIYAIARMVVFNDPIVANSRPDLAIPDENGGTWKGADGNPWVNPFNHDLWQPNIDLAVEAAGMGFDEIQYDYIRFPSDGDLSTADFGPNYTEDGRVAAIVDFLKESHKQLQPTGAKLAVDVFGIVAIYGDDQGIGQRLADIAPVVDYVCPMVYPSHFDPTAIDVGGDPNDHPYETIQLSLALAKEKMPGLEMKLRPWLQDFDLGRKYTTEDVKVQIQASDEADTSGWMLWNAANEYTDDALEAQ
jgi:hypothetical protein